MRDSRRTIPRKNIWRPQIAQKGAALYEALQEHQSVNIRQISQNRAEQVGYYRFLENEKVTVSEKRAKYVSALPTKRRTTTRISHQ